MRPLAEFIKNQWFLLILAVALVVGYRWNAPPSAFKSNVGLTILVVPQLFLMSFTLPTGELLGGLRNIRAVILGAFVGFVLMPLLAAGISGSQALFPLSSLPIAFGLLAMTAGPTTQTSNIVWSRLAKANDALSLGLTILLTSLCFIVSPALIRLLGPYVLSRATTGGVDLGNALNQSFDVAAMAWSMFLKVVLPSALGQAARLIYKPDSPKLKNAVRIFCQTTVLLLVWASIGEASLNVERQTGALGLSSIAPPRVIAALIGACIVVHGAGMLLIHYGARAMSFDDRDRKAVILTGAQKTLPVSALILDDLIRANAIPGVEIGLGIIALVAFHATQLLFDTIVVSVWNRTRSEERPSGS